LVEVGFHLELEDFYQRFPFIVRVEKFHLGKSKEKVTDLMPFKVLKVRLKLLGVLENALEHSPEFKAFLHLRIDV
jgi:hypothetical protein